MSIKKEDKSSLIKEYGSSSTDTGSPEVQCAVFTAQIKALTGHFNANPKDFQARRGLLVIVNKRKRLLTYVKSKNPERHKALITRLGLRK